MHAIGFVSFHFGKLTLFPERDISLGRMSFEFSFTYKVYDTKKFAKCKLFLGLKKLTSFSFNFVIRLCLLFVKHTP